MEKQVSKNIYFFVSWLVLFFCLFFLSRYSQSQNGFEVIGLYAISFVSYFHLIYNANHILKKYLYIGSFLLFGACFLQLPFLSNDYFRFLWDGELMHMGINPYDFTPDQMVQTMNLSDCYYLDLYAGMGNLSRANYSCYPTINQGYFYLSTFTNDIWSNVTILRLLMVGTISLSIIPVEKLLKHFNFNTKRIFILFFNPLVIVECIGNLHFELAMVAFLLMAFYYLLINKTVLSSLLFAVTVHVKLIPLLILPFLLSFLGWKKAAKYYTLVGGMIVLLFLMLIRPDNYVNFLMSLKLYFKSFEFNSFLLYPYIQFGKLKYGWNMMYKYGPQLARYALVIILGIAWNKREIDAKEMFRRVLMGLMVYYFFTSTVHPWYWVLPLSLAIIHFSWTLILITFFTTLSYGIYAAHGSSGYRILLSSVNGVLIIMYWIEVFKPKWFSRFRPAILN